MLSPYCLSSPPPLQAKRSAREAGRGFDAGAVMQRLLSFMDQRGDMMALEPAGKHGLVRGGGGE